jgi:hypothetical protein
MNSSNNPPNNQNQGDYDLDHSRDNNYAARNNPRDPVNAYYDTTSISSYGRPHQQPQMTAYVPVDMHNHPNHHPSYEEMAVSGMNLHAINPMLFHYLPLPVQYAHFQAQQTPLFYNPFPPTSDPNPHRDISESNSGSNKRKADYEPDNDDEDDDEDLPTNYGDETKSTGSKRSGNIRENSKIQREKRKAYVKNLEYLAKELSESSSSNHQKLEEDFETLNIVHQTLKLQAIAFIRLLFNIEARDASNESTKSWPDVLESPAFGGFELSVPPLSFAYKPPADLEGNATMLRLTNASEVLSFTAGLHIAFETIARTGTNICDSLRFHMKIGKKSFIVDKNLVCFSLIIESYNAKILGGMSDISWKGKPAAPGHHHS